MAKNIYKINFIEKEKGRNEIADGLFGVFLSRFIFGRINWLGPGCPVDWPQFGASIHLA